MLVDVVVRDRRGQPVKDLTQADFEILEDGVTQTIGSFTPILESVLGSTVAPGCAPAAPAGNAAAPAPRRHRCRARRHRDCLPRPQPRGPEARGGVGAGLPRTEGRDVELRRHLRDRPLARASRSFHPQRLCGPPGAEPHGDREQRRVQCPGNAAAAHQRRECAASATAAANSATAAAGAGNSGNVGTAAGDAKLAQMEASIVSGFQAMDATSRATSRPTR